jgi:uncharacterized protein YecE (DUF72 family)
MGKRFGSRLSSRLRANRFLCSEVSEQTSQSGLVCAVVLPCAEISDVPSLPEMGLIFEFGTFNKKTFPTPADFLTALDPFLKSLPEGFRYGVEIRNEDYLTPQYFDVLASHNVAHVLNAWTRMPALDDQARLPGVCTADFTVVRALPRRGRPYDQAVETFEPYDRIQEPNESAREGMRMIAQNALKSKKSAFVFVNTRLEGNAPSTIEAVVEGIESRTAEAKAG